MTTTKRTNADHIEALTAAIELIETTSDELSHLLECGPAHGTVADRGILDQLHTVKLRAIEERDRARQSSLKRPTSAKRKGPQP